MLLFKNTYKVIFCLFFLAIQWIILSQIFDNFLLLCGLIAILFSALILKYLEVLFGIKISFQGIRYIVRILYDIWVTSIKLTKIIWSDKMLLDPHVGVVNFKNLDNPLLTTMRANAITMTPGTIVIGVHDNQMLVHFVCKNDYSDQPSAAIEEIIL